jgi:hypothetical protein
MHPPMIMVRRWVMATPAFVLALLAGANVLAAPPGPPHPGARIVSALPAALRDPDLRPALFRTVTSYEVTAAEYRSLGLADRGRMFTDGGYKVSAVSDDRHRLALVERSCCALQEWVLFGPAVPLGADATPAGLSGVAVGGIRIGSSAESVERRFGRNGAGAAKGAAGLLRYRHARTPNCSTFYTFDLDRHRVRAISVKNAC